MTTLVAYDGMEHTKKALDYSIKHSIVYKSKLYIFSAVTSKDQLDKEREMARINTFLEEAYQRAKEAGANVQIVLGSGVPGKGIREAAERFDADTIIVGRSDKTMFDRAVLGSVSEDVVRNAKCVVIVVQ